MVSINKRKSKKKQKQKQKQETLNYLFKLDTDIKQLLKSLPHSMAIDILNAIGKTNFPITALYPSVVLKVLVLQALRRKNL